LATCRNYLQFNSRIANFEITQYQGADMYMTEQEEFWGLKYGKEYIEKNAEFDLALGIQAWSDMLKKAKNVTIPKLIESPMPF
jgi:hypothetical protein